MDEHNNFGQVYGIRLGYSSDGRIQCISDTTLTIDKEGTTLSKHNDTLEELFSIPVPLGIPQKDSYDTYTEENILQMIRHGPLSVHRIEQESDTLKRVVYITPPKPDNKTIIIIEQTLHTKDPINWILKGRVITDTDPDSTDTPLLDLGRTRIRPLYGEPTTDNGLTFQLHYGKNTAVFEVETLPLYEDIEDTLIVADTDQVEQLMVASAFFTDHKLLPVVLLDPAKNNQDTQSEKKTKKRNKIINRILFDLKPKTIIVLTPNINVHFIEDIADKIQAKVHLIHKAYASQDHKLPYITVHPTRKLTGIVKAFKDIFNEPVIEYLSVENISQYLPLASVLSRLLGNKKGIPVIPLIQIDPIYEMRIGSRKYGDTQYCGDIHDVAASIQKLMDTTSRESVIVELDSEDSIMRSLIGANYAYLRRNVPVPVTMDLDIGLKIRNTLIDKPDYTLIKNVLEDYKWENDPLSILRQTVENNYKNYNIHLLKLYIQIFAAEVKRDIDSLCHDPIAYSYITDCILNMPTHQQLEESLEKIGDNKIKKFCENGYNFTIAGSITDSLPSMIAWNNFFKDFVNTISEHITSSVSKFLPLFTKTHYIAAFTSATPYNLVQEYTNSKEDDNTGYWASKYAIGHFLVSDAVNTSVSLINSLLYTSGRKNPVSTVLVVSPHEMTGRRGIHTVCRSAAAGLAQLSDTANIKDVAGNYWSLVLALKNEDASKELVLNLADTVPWAEMHFSTHGGEKNITVKGNKEITSIELKNLDLHHSMVGMNACDTYHSTGKHLLSTMAYGGYVTLYSVNDPIADAIGYNVFQDDMIGYPASESLRRALSSLLNNRGLKVKDENRFKDDTLTELAYMFVGLPTAKIYTNKLDESHKKDVDRHKVNYLFNLVTDWVEEKKANPEVIVRQFMELADEYEAELDSNDRKDLQFLYLMRGVVAYHIGKFEEAAKHFKKALEYTDNSQYIGRTYILVNAIAAYGNAGDLPAAASSMSELTSLAVKFPDNAEINLRRANGLFNIITYYGNAGDLPSAASSMFELTSLAAKFPDNAEINLVRANGLFNIIAAYGDAGAGDLSEAASSMSELTSLAGKFPDNAEINLRRANGLFNIITYYGNAGDLPSAASSMFELTFLAAKFPDYAEINLERAKGLVNIIAAYGKAGHLREATSYMSELTSIAAKFPDNAEINLVRANGLLNFIKAYVKAGQLPEAASSMSELTSLAAKFPDNAEINLERANGLLNFIKAYVKAGHLPDAASSMSELTSLAAKFPDNAEINLKRANGLFNIITDYGNAGDLPSAASSMFELTSLAAKFLDNGEINLKRASGLVNTIAYYGKAGHLPDTASSMFELTSLAAKFPDNAGFNLARANGLVNIIAVYAYAGKLSEASTHLESLEQLADTFFDNTEIQNLWTKALEYYLREKRRHSRKT